jgi:hypothetical protein
MDEPGRGSADVRRLAARAASRATSSFEGARELGLAEIVAQVRSTAIDLMRAADAVAPPGDTPEEAQSEELLLELFENEETPSI